MKRPFVNINSENITEELLSALHNDIDHFLAFKDIIGIMLDGGLSRGYADHLSEIDIVIFLSQEQYQKYKKSKTPVPLGITKLNGYLYDIKIEDFDEATGRKYDMVALWDLSYAKIIYDPFNKLSEFINKKLSQPINIAHAEGLMFESWWNYHLAGDIWINRKDIIQGHFILNNSLKPLISALFIVNEEYIPHDKWIIHMSRTLEWKPENWDDILTKIFSTGNLDIESLIARQQAISDLWNEIDKKFTGLVDLKVSYMQKYFYDTFKLLVEKGEMDIHEWEKISSFNTLNSQLFHDVTYIKNERIMVDRNRLLSLKPEDLYDWFYEVADTVRAQIK